MTIVSSEASRGTNREKRKRKSVVESDSKYDASTENGPPESKKLQSSFEGNKNALLNDELSNAMQIIKQKYGSVVADDIVKTLNGAICTKEDEIKSHPVSTDTCVSQLDMKKCMQKMFVQMMQSNIASISVPDFTIKNSEFVMRSRYNGDEDDDDTNSVVTTMDFLPTANSLSANKYVSDDKQLEMQGKKEQSKVLPSGNEEKIQNYHDYSSPRSVTISNPFAASSKFALATKGEEAGAGTQKPLLISKSKVDSLSGTQSQKLLHSDASYNFYSYDKKDVKEEDYEKKECYTESCNVSTINDNRNDINNSEKIVITTCSDLGINSITNESVTSISPTVEANSMIACCDVVTSISNQANLNNLSNSNSEVSSSFLKFCDEINECSDGSSDGTKSPVYEPIATVEKHSVSGNDLGKDAFPFSFNNLNFLNAFPYTNPFESFNVSSSWDSEITELQSKLLNESAVVSDVLLNDSNYTQSNAMGSLRYNNGLEGNSFTTLETQSEVKHDAWYYDCIKNLSLQDDDGDTALHVAIIKEEPRAVHLLPLLKPSDLNIRNNRGQTPLHLACYLHQTELIHALLSAGADPNIVDENGNTILHIACEEEESFSMVECILKLIPRPSCVMLNHHNNNGWTPLHVAVKRRKHDIVQCLVEYGCDLNIQDEKSGSTVLIYALMLHDKPLIRLLLDKGADVNISTQSGLNALNYAAQACDIDLVKELIERDAVINGSKLPVFPASHPDAAEMKKTLENELLKRRRKKMKGNGRKAANTSK